MRALRYCVLALVLVAATASADRGVAERYFRAGEKAYHAQDFESAAQNFELAYKELALPEIAFSAAQAYRRQWRIEPKPQYVHRAILLYQEYLKRVKTGGRVADAADGLAEMQHELEKLGGAGKPSGEDADPTRLGVSVLFADVHDAPIGAVREVDDPHAAATPPVTAAIDGKPWPVDKLMHVEPGEHVVRAEAPGYQPREKTVRVLAGAPDIVELTLDPLPAQVVVHTEDGATISVDGRRTGSAPLAAIAMPGGHHLLTVTARGREVAGRELDVTRAQHTEIEVPLVPTARRRAVPWVVVSAGAFGALCLLTTSGALYWNSHARDLRDQIDRGNASQTTYASYNDARDHRDLARAAALTTGGLAIGAGLAAAWLYYFDRPTAEGVRIAPAAGPGGAGAMLFGRF